VKIPFGSDDEMSNRSLGKKWLLLTLTKSPTLTVFQTLVSHLVVFLLSSRTGVRLTIRSALCLFMSSYDSLTADTIKMNESGRIVVYFPVGDTFGICWMIALNRKNRYEYCLNCSNRNRGTNEIMLYLAVVIRFDANLFADISLTDIFRFGGEDISPINQFIWCTKFYASLILAQLMA
jgi:hypothetical protein